MCSLRPRLLLAAVATVLFVLQPTARADAVVPEDDSRETQPGPAYPASRASAEFADSYFLVRLNAPLTTRDSAGHFARRTGHPPLDIAIEQAAVHRIEHALRVSMRSPRDPGALRDPGLRC